MLSLSQLLQNLTRDQSKRTAGKRHPGQCPTRTFSSAGEALEERIALTIYNPVVAPLVTAKEGTNVTVALGTFDSTDPLGGLSATVTWADGTTATPTSAVTIVRSGSEFVPGVGNVPQYLLQASFTATTSTDGVQPQFRVNVSDASDATSATLVGTMQILPGTTVAAAHAEADVFSVPENSSAVILSVLANDTGTGLTITGVNGAPNGVLTIANNGTGVSYQPNADFSGLDSFSYSITDGANHTSSATVLVGVTKGATTTPATVALANGDVLSVAQNGAPTSFAVLANDVGDGLQVTGVTAPAHGHLTIDNSGTSVTYQPAFGFTGTDSFTYTITDSTSHTSTATALVGVTPVSQPPLLLTPDSATTLVNNSSAIHGIAVYDFNTAGGIELVTLSVEHGTISIASTAGVAFMPGTSATDSTLITFAGTLDAVNHALDSLTYKGARDTSVADTLSISVSNPGILGDPSAPTADATVPILPKYHSVDVLSDPLAPGKLSLVINGSDPQSGANDVIAVIPGPVKNSYQVIQNGVARPLFTGITGRILVFGQDGGNDTIGIGSGVTARTLLVGGAGNDVIVGGSGADFISGGAGHNTLSGGAGGMNTLLEATTDDMILRSGTAKVNGSLISGTTVDTLAKVTFQNAQLTHLGATGVTLDAIAFSGNTVLIGGTGADTLRGGSGYNVLIGGGGADVLIGGKMQDLLVAGSTAFDQNVAALSDILAEWSTTTTDYAFKVAHITGLKTGGKNGASLLNASTVVSDGLATILTGGAGRDFFIKLGAEVISDRVTTTAPLFESVLQLR